MPIYCCVKGCNSQQSTANRPAYNGKEVSFHRVTANIEGLIRDRNIEFKNKDAKWNRICSLHIDDQHKGLVKCRNHHHPQIEHVDHSYTTFSAPIEVQRRDEVREVKAKLKRTMAKCKRQEERLKSQEQKIRMLEGKQQELIMRLKESEVKQKTWEDTGPVTEKGLYDFLSNIQHNAGCAGSGRRYSEKMKEVALTIYKYSPRCYRYLRTIVPLPSKESLKKMRKSLDGDAGATVDAAAADAAQQAVDDVHVEARNGTGQEAVQVQGVNGAQYLNELDVLQAVQNVHVFPVNQVTDSVTAVAHQPYAVVHPPYAVETNYVY